MSKLRADITYKRRREPDTSLSTFFRATSTQVASGNDVTKPSNENETTAVNETLEEEDNSQSVETENEENDSSSISEVEFGEYLQEWVEMLEEEIDTIEDRGDISELDDMDGIIHPAINEDAVTSLGIDQGG